MGHLHTNQGRETSRSSFDLKETRDNVREALKRADLKIEKHIPGEKSGDKAVGALAGKLFSYQISGERVEESSGRYYMSSRLQKLSEKLGIHVELRRVRRNASEIFVDVFMSEDDADDARHAEDLRKAENPTTPASKYYYRSKAGLTGKGRSDTN
jgi:hypothetical protein